ncbi:MAG TPA: FAD-binding oxidoreductase [Candidatus Paceibacterota bacterium]|nr:FAD-binding oxidoreductase [Candidatus Paceibacterota bacterium]
MKNEIFWKNQGYKIRSELRGNIECEYLIVGGGITGVSAAYFLAKSGSKNIVLVEKNYIGSGATGKAAGTLVLRGEADLGDLYKNHGPKKARLYWQGLHEALKKIKKVILEEKIDCDAEPQDTLYCGSIRKTHVDLRHEYTLEKRLEKKTKFLKGDQFKKELNTNLFTHGMLSSLHGLSVNPLKLVQNLSVKLEKYGVKIYEQTALLQTSQNIAKMEHGTVRYKKLISAVDLDNPIFRVRNQKTTIAITRPLTESELVQTGLKKKKIVYDSKKNYNYFKVLKDNRMLFGYGIILVHKKERRTDLHIPHLRRIESFIKKLFPYLNLETEYAWTGNFGVTRSYEPLIELENDAVKISGVGSQVVCFMAAEHVVNKLLGKKSKMDEYLKTIVE